MIYLKNKKINSIFLSNKKIFKAFKGTDLVYSEQTKIYQEVEYIEGTGTQYIDTGITLNQNSSVELGLALTVKNDLNKMFFGSRNGASGNNISVNVTGSIVLDFNNSGFSSYRASFNGYETNTKYILYISKNERTIYDSNGKALIRNATVCNDTITTIQTATIFYINPHPAGTWYNGSGKIYYCKIWNNSELIMHLIPCYRKTDGEIGLYDIVGNQFYTNVGTGKFIKGGDV